MRRRRQPEASAEVAAASAMIVRSAAINRLADGHRYRHGSSAPEWQNHHFRRSHNRWGRVQSRWQGRNRHQQSVAVRHRSRNRYRQRVISGRMPRPFVVITTGASRRSASGLISAPMQPPPARMTGRFCILQHGCHGADAVLMGRAGIFCPLVLVPLHGASSASADLPEFQYGRGGGADLQKC